MILATKRLFLRNLQPEDIPVIHAYRNNPDCARYQRWEDTSLASVTQFVTDFGSCEFLSKQEEQHYAICMNGEGMVGDLSCFYTEKDCCITLGITIRSEYRQQGIAREILQAVISAVQFHYPELDIVALIDPENLGSIRLFEGLGFYRECYAASINSYVYTIDGKRDSPK